MPRGTPKHVSIRLRLDGPDVQVLDRLVEVLGPRMGFLGGDLGIAREHLARAALRQGLAWMTREDEQTRAEAEAVNEIVAGVAAERVKPRR